MNRRPLVGVTGHNSSGPLIGITGHAGAGKDSVAHILMGEYGYKRQAFADALRLEVWIKSARSLAHMLGEGHHLDWPEWLDYIEQHKHDPLDSPHGWPRQLLQAWGSMRRDLCGHNYWVDQIMLEPGIVVSDVRYTNEADAIRVRGGLLWRVVRPGCYGDAHASEVEVDGLPVNQTIGNTGSLDDLRIKVRLALTDAMSRAKETV